MKYLIYWECVLYKENISKWLHLFLFKMKDTCPDDSEPYDTTSDSEEEYVPDPNSDSEDSDESHDPKQRKCLLYDVSNDRASESPTICDTTTPDLDILFTRKVLW